MIAFQVTPMTSTLQWHHAGQNHPGDMFQYLKNEPAFRMCYTFNIPLSEMNLKTTHSTFPACSLDEKHWNHAPNTYFATTHGPKLSCFFLPTSQVKYGLFIGKKTLSPLLMNQEESSRSVNRLYQSFKDGCPHWDSGQAHLQAGHKQGQLTYVALTSPGCCRCSHTSLLCGNSCTLQA